MTPLPKDPTAPRKKYALIKWVRRWNHAHPSRAIARPEGFDPETEVVGEPARELLRAMQRAAGLEVTGRFDGPTMLRFFPMTVRGRVMAKAHSELGVHEWPPYSNRGEVLKYLKAAGIPFGAPWCASFVTWVLKECGFKKFPSNPASAWDWYLFGKRHDLLRPVAKSEPGDLWGWEWSRDFKGGGSDGMYDHIGFCDDRKPGDQVAYYLDGNVGANGGTVTAASRSAAYIAYVIDLEKLSRL